MNITTANIGSAKNLLVTILSILSDVESFFSDFFAKHPLIIEDIYVYLSLVIILSVSSSNSFSRVSISAETSGTFFIRTLILSSFSRSLIAKNLFCSSTISRPSLSSTAIVLSFLLSASLTAFSAASLMPVPLRADISTASHPRFFPNLARSTLSPFFSMISTMLTAMITGIPSSIICVER